MHAGLLRPNTMCFPIDECYKLVGSDSSKLEGASGGTEVWQEIGKFFDSLKQRATVVGEEARA